MINELIHLKPLKPVAGPVKYLININSKHLININFYYYCFICPLFSGDSWHVQSRTDHLSKWHFLPLSYSHQKSTAFLEFSHADTNYYQVSLTLTPMFLKLSSILSATLNQPYLLSHLSNWTGFLIGFPASSPVPSPNNSSAQKLEWSLNNINWIMSLLSLKYFMVSHWTEDKIQNP